MSGHIGGGTYIDYVAGAWPFHFALVASFVPRLPISHPVDHGGTVISDRPLHNVNWIALLYNDWVIGWEKTTEKTPDSTPGATNCSAKGALRIYLVHVKIHRA